MSRRTFSWKPFIVNKLWTIPGGAVTVGRLRAGLFILIQNRLDRNHDWEHTGARRMSGLL